MKYRNEITAWLLAHQDAMLKDLRELIAIPSVKGEPLPGAPFGEAPAKALQKMLDCCAAYGFSTDNADNYAGSAELNALPAELGILVHLDVVPAGDGWEHDPFTLTEDPVSGKLIGRGASDDKGPAIAALYAMRAVKELQIPLKHGVRLIFGTDEENGSADLTYYREHRTLPPHVFTPDGDYPVITTEKGMIRLRLTAEVPDGEVLEISSGEAINALPASATARLKDENWMVIGTNAHASTPEAGDNALTKLLAQLHQHLPRGAQQLFFRHLAACFPHGETNGKSCGIAAADESGALTCVLSVMQVKEGQMTAYCDIRYPVSADGEEICRKLQKKLHPVQMEVMLCDPPHHTEETSAFVQTLLKVYEDMTGLPGKCLAIGGGTYVHHIDGGVAFGAGFPECDVHMHGAEEFIRKDHFLLNAEIMAMAILQLCGQEEDNGTQEEN